MTCPSIRLQAEDPLSPVSPTMGAQTPHTSKSHVEAWQEVSETLIIFDWDDTLFPTTYVWNDPRLRWDRPAPCFGGALGAATVPAELDWPEGPSMRELLEQHASTASALLRLAKTLGHVVIVTLAEEGWVEMSIRHFQPSLTGLLEDLGIEVICARSSVPPRLLRMATQEGQDLGKVLKTRAMEKVVKRFYGRGRGHNGEKPRSWKNVISIGDSPGERLAVQDVIWRKKQTDSRGVEKRCRCKAVKIASEPHLAQLTAELQVLTMWLRALVVHDDDVDLDFSELDETMETPIDAWPELA